ncbi:MAG: platelet-activating factor acetylhydrolase IB subunit [Verrucomicrobiota bacterium]
MKKSIKLPSHLWLLLCGGWLFLTAGNVSGQDVLSTIPEAKSYQLVYDFDIGKAAKTITYDADNSAQITQPFDRVAYLLELSKDGKAQWVYVSMNTFTDDIRKTGVPTFESKAVYQQQVEKLTVFSNTKDMVTGSGLTGNIEFWPNNYGAANAINIPGASPSAFDFGDEIKPTGDYGSMQVHNFEAKQTLFAFNHWAAGKGCDLGIGNAPTGNADWTFAKNGAAYETKRLRVLVRIAPGFKFKALPQASAPAATIPASGTPAATQEAHQNTAIIPVPRTGPITNRQSQVLQRAKDAPGDYDVEFIGDSITQGWEGGGKNVWAEYYGKRKAINFGVSGDRTQHVLWRFEQGQLDGIKAKVAVVMIGTNNSGNDPEEDMLAGVTAIVKQIRVRQPSTKILLLGIFPRTKTFSIQRGKNLQVNQALARLDDGKNIFYLDIGPQLIENDGSISKDVMPDALHPNEAGYKIWAAAIEPKLKQLLGEK